MTFSKELRKLSGHSGQQTIETAIRALERSARQRQLWRRGQMYCWCNSLSHTYSRHFLSRIEYFWGLETPTRQTVEPRTRCVYGRPAGDGLLEIRKWSFQVQLCDASDFSTVEISAGPPGGMYIAVNSQDLVKQHALSLVVRTGTVSQLVIIAASHSTSL